MSPAAIPEEQHSVDACPSQQALCEAQPAAAGPIGRSVKIIDTFSCLRLGVLPKLLGGDIAVGYALPRRAPSGITAKSGGLQE